MKKIPVKIEIDKEFLNKLRKMVPPNQKEKDFLDKTFNEAIVWYLNKLEKKEKIE